MASQYDEPIDSVQARGETLVRWEYTIAHNVLCGALDHVETYRFSPHKDFSVAKYLLEEDTKDIELIDIEFDFSGRLFLILRPDQMPDFYINRLNKEVRFQEKIVPAGGQGII